ncbi:MAG: DNA-binding protein, partial [Candidatus Hermodarchaeota archaeon]|jgi:predicted DNA-binding protein with PD1-like motif|nr:DNA-binding protein [Candidatus Hermodarchaeota archaeon]
MQFRKFPLKDLIVSRIKPGEDLLDSVRQVIVDSQVTAGFLSIIGAVDRACYGFYIPETRSYISQTWEPSSNSSPALEILSCLGNVAILDGEVVVHAHITLSGVKGELVGGHLQQGCRVNPTAELTLLTAKGILTRKRNETLNLALLSI